MKKRLLAILLLISGYACAQTMPDMSTKVRITGPDKTIVAEVNEVGEVTSTKSDLFYFWYYAGGIHSTQGGYSGKLLDGSYNEYYLSKTLKQQGTFKKGLKNGSWKSWNEDGTLKEDILWKNGKILKEKEASFWKRLPLLKHKKTQPDSTMTVIHKTSK
jgi:antitoxin component YwqK of YwqJK toxin-antitoxin module